MLICLPNKCTGCYACVATCPQKCISMQENEYGELHPVVDVLECVQCGLYREICPNDKSQVFQYPINCYAAWITDKKKRRICASGGIGTMGIHLSKLLSESNVEVYVSSRSEYKDEKLSIIC